MAEPSMTKWQTEWGKCCLCQHDKNELLISPPTFYNVASDGYKNIATNFPLFHATNALSINLNPHRRDGGDGIEDALRRNKTKYHQSCRLMFKNTKLERAVKRVPETKTDDISSPKMKRSKSEPEDVLKCFLCEKEDNASSLHQTMTMKLSNRLNQCAVTLSDDNLLAKTQWRRCGGTEIKISCWLLSLIV